jgi:predicted DNA-binding transcriptional regulator AlpA
VQHDELFPNGQVASALEINAPPEGAPILVDASGVARLLSIGRSQVFRLNSAGRLPMPIRKLGARCPRWRVDELRDWVAAGCPDRATWQNTQRRSI